MRVLIVDGSIQIMDRLAEILSESSFVSIIHKTVSSEEALTAFANHPPDVVLLDIFLPGNESLALLKAFTTSVNDPMIILAGHRGNFFLEQLRSFGDHPFFDKYHDFEQIISLIESIAATKLKNRQNPAPHAQTV